MSQQKLKRIVLLWEDILNKINYDNLIDNFTSQKN